MSSTHWPCWHPTNPTVFLFSQPELPSVTWATFTTTGVIYLQTADFSIWFGPFVHAQIRRQHNFFQDKGAWKRLFSCLHAYGRLKEFRNLFRKIPPSPIKHPAACACWCYSSSFVILLSKPKAAFQVSVGQLEQLHRQAKLTMWSVFRKAVINLDGTLYTHQFYVNLLMVLEIIYFFLTLRAKYPNKLNKFKKANNKHDRQFSELSEDCRYDYI